MDTFLWVTFSWPWPVFALMVTLCIVTFNIIGRSLGWTLLALVIYGGTVWIPLHEAFVQVFWLTLLAGVVGLVWGLINGGGRWLAMIASIVAVATSVILANSQIW